MTLWPYQLKKLPRGIFVKTHFVRFDRSAHVEIYYKGISIPLPFLFWTGGNSVLFSFSMALNFIDHLENKTDDHSGFLEELEVKSTNRFLFSPKPREQRHWNFFVINFHMSASVNANTVRHYRNVTW